jgi:uncharacterized protein (DUF58 family)
VFSENGLDEIQPRARQAAIGPLFDAIVRHNTALSADDPRASDPSLLNAAIERAMRMLPHDGLLALITDAAGANAETEQLVTQVTAHNDVLAVFVSDPLEGRLPDIGRVVVCEAGTQIEIDSSARNLRAGFVAGFRQRREAVESFSRRRVMPVLPLSTARDTTEQFQELLGRRMAQSAAPNGARRVP